MYTAFQIIPPAKQMPPDGHGPHTARQGPVPPTTLTTMRVKGCEAEILLQTCRYSVQAAAIVW